MYALIEIGNGCTLHLHHITVTRHIVLNSDTLHALGLVLN
jgi:hypothetical protein